MYMYMSFARELDATSNSLRWPASTFKQKRKCEFSISSLLVILGFAYVLLFVKQSQIDAKFGNHKRNESFIFSAVFGAFKSKNDKRLTINETIKTRAKFHANLP